MKNELLKSLKAKYEALQAQIENDYSSSEPPVELQNALKEAISEYQNAKAEAQKEAEKNNKKGVVVTMNKKAMKNKIFRALIKGQEFTDEMKSSGIQLPKMLDTIPDEGNVEAVGERGGYLVDEEFFSVDEFGGEVVRIPATDISVSKPTGKAPFFDREQAKAAGAFLVPVDELDLITETHPVYGQLDYATVDKYGIVPISTQVINDAEFDLVAAAGECFSIAAACQRNLDIINAVANIPQITKVGAGQGKGFADIEGAKAIQKAILTLKGTNRKNATIVCSTDVWAKLANLTDKNDNPLLMRDVNNPAIYRLFGVEVIELEDDATGKCFVGNFARVAYINRQGIVISVDYSAGFTRNAVLVKGGKRACAKVRENRAFVQVVEGAIA